MIGLDTNVLVRLLVADDPAQTEQARRFVSSRCTPGSPAFINCIVLVEVVWVLGSLYDYRPSEIAGAIDSLLSGDDRVVEYHDEVRAGLEDYKSGRADFVDALIMRINRARGCDVTATFDHKAAKLDGFMRVA
jgi:predicted nucleic-acid-binding protein